MLWAACSGRVVISIRANRLLRQAVEVRCETLGSQHPKSVVSVNSLDQLLKAKRERFISQVPKTTTALPLRIVEPAAPADQVPPTAPVKTTVPVAEALRPATVEPVVPVTASLPVAERFAVRLERVQSEFAGLSGRFTQIGEGLLQGVLPGV